MKKLLIVIDMQNDFIYGPLGTDEAVKIVEKVVRKIQQYEKNGDRILFTMDTHFNDYLKTQEGKNLPVKHCIKNTKGWQICDEILNGCNLTQHKIYEKTTFGSVQLVQDLYNGVYDPVSSIELVGLCTDICVISNAMLIKAFLPEVPLTVDASCCAGVTPDSHINALNAMKMCQIKVIEN